MRSEAFFLPVPGDTPSQRLCVYHPAQGAAAKALVVYVHPFAEEMNKSRRMAALQARALASAGCAVLQIDLLGCGDSSGDFGDATWQAWVDDVVRASAWLQAKAGTATSTALWLWGLRAGCLVAVAAATKLAAPWRLLFWQPPTAGKALLQQFLRLKLAADMAGGKGVIEGLRRQLAEGQAVEVAGYRLGPALADGLQAASLAPPQRAGRVAWIELSTRDDATLLPASRSTIAAWEEAGWAVSPRIVHGPAFWQTVEIEEAPALLDATIAALAAQPQKALA